MTIIGEARIEERVMSEHFACDVMRCRGACCTLPGRRGAPLEDEEVAEIECALPAIRKHLPALHQNIIASSGWLEGSAGDYTTSCVGDRDCVFVFYEGGVAKCAFERAYIDGDSDWRKPISCHLFPVRIGRMDGEFLRYEEIEQCDPALERGRAERIPLYEFLKEPLVRKYGGSWYASFVGKCRNLDRSDVRQ